MLSDRNARPRGTHARLATLCIFALALPAISVALIKPDDAGPPHVASPWGISSSASSFRNHTEWLPKMAAAGVTSVRLFPEWPHFEPTRGTWKWDQTDAFVKDAATNKIEITGIFMGSRPGVKPSHTFPMDDLEGWSKYVGAVAGRYKSIRYWEVWNEGNAGFNDGHHATADYAKLASTAYAAAKKAAPETKVGLSVASFDAPYLNQAILAMAKQGRPSSLDFISIHPYEIADGLADPDGEIPFLWMSQFLRGMLKSSAPDRADAEIWITEVARRVEKRKDRNVTDLDAAKALAKIYTMAIAQGVARTQWFEAQDPVGEDAGFGLLRRDGTARISYTTFKTLTTHLGAMPKYDGWLALGKDGKGYGFVFNGKSGPVLALWMPAGRTDKISFGKDVEVIDTLNGTANTLKVPRPLWLTDEPVLVVGIPPELLKEARANKGKSFPWGGDYSKAKTISLEPGSTEGGKGIFQTQRDATPTLKFADGSTGILVRGDQGVGFYCHPSFASFGTKEYYVRVSVRRVAPGNVGMNLNYEVADSQGRTPYKNRGIWFGANESNDWQQFTWHVTDACFSKMWGYDFSFRPELSVPFVIGKVEVSIEPFK